MSALVRMFLDLLIHYLIDTEMDKYNYYGHFLQLQLSSVDNFKALRIYNFARNKSYNSPFTSLI